MRLLLILLLSIGCKKIVEKDSNKSSLKDYKNHPISAKLFEHENLRTTPEVKTAIKKLMQYGAYYGARAQGSSGGKVGLGRSKMFNGDCERFSNIKYPEKRFDRADGDPGHGFFPCKYIRPLDTASDIFGNLDSDNTAPTIDLEKTKSWIQYMIEGQTNDSTLQSYLATSQTNSSAEFSRLKQRELTYKENMFAILGLSPQKILFYWDICNIYPEEEENTFISKVKAGMRKSSLPSNDAVGFYMDRLARTIYPKMMDHKDTEMVTTFCNIMAGRGWKKLLQTKNYYADYPIYDPRIPNNQRDQHHYYLEVTTPGTSKPLTIYEGEYDAIDNFEIAPYGSSNLFFRFRLGVFNPAAEVASVSPNEEVVEDFNEKFEDYTFEVRDIETYVRSEGEDLASLICKENKGTNCNSEIFQRKFKTRHYPFWPNFEVPDFFRQDGTGISEDLEGAQNKRNEREALFNEVTNAQNQRDAVQSVATTDKDAENIFGSLNLDKPIYPVVRLPYARDTLHERYWKHETLLTNNLNYVDGFYTVSIIPKECINHLRSPENCNVQWDENYDDNVIVRIKLLSIFYDIRTAQKLTSLFMKQVAGLNLSPYFGYINFLHDIPTIDLEYNPKNNSFSPISTYSEKIKFLNMESGDFIHSANRQLEGMEDYVECKDILSHMKIAKTGSSDTWSSHGIYVKNNSFSKEARDAYNELSAVKKIMEFKGNIKCFNVSPASYSNKDGVSVYELESPNTEVTLEKLMNELKNNWSYVGDNEKANCKISFTHPLNFEQICTCDKNQEPFCSRTK